MCACTDGSGHEAGTMLKRLLRGPAQRLPGIHTHLISSSVPRLGCVLDIGGFHRPLQRQLFEHPTSSQRSVQQSAHEVCRTFTRLDHRSAFHTNASFGTRMCNLHLTSVEKKKESNSSPPASVLSTTPWRLSTVKTRVDLNSPMRFARSKELMVRIMRSVSCSAR